MNKFNEKYNDLQKSMVSPKGLDDNRARIVKDFEDFAIKELGIKARPKTTFNDDKNRVAALRSMATYAPAKNTVWVYIGNRNLADILRSLGHEFVHCRQKETNEQLDGSTGSKDENEANSMSGVLLRKYGKLKPEIYE